ncbi:MAG: ATPase [Gammaproteobacteria bacterium]|nr:ATPase [Gammaproteobacteria bacterium]
MALRPEPAHWFDCLIARDDLTVTVETLANSGQIQLETRAADEETGTLTDLSALLDEFHQLASHYHLYWPQAVAPSTITGKPARTLHRALQQLRLWAEQADMPIRELERLQAESTDLLHLREWLQVLQTTLETGSTLDIGELFNTGPLLTTLLYRIAAQAELPPLPPRWFAWEIAQQLDRDVLLIGPAADAEQLAHDFSAHRVRRIPLPTWLHGSARAAISQIDARLQIHAKRNKELQRQLEAAHHEFGLTEALGEIARLDWFLRHVRYQTSGANLAWIRGWSSAPDADLLQDALATAGVRALVQFSTPPKGTKAPLVLRNPRWARAFELFPRLLGMPSATETDPSRMLALLVPLLFGYMFGDLGQGFVILLAGLLLRRKWPQAVLLVPAGASSMIFGVLFGSLFAREDLIPALWLHPVTEPLKVLGLPIAGGIALLLLGLLLNGVQAGWRNESRHWFWREAPVILIYVSIIAMFITPGAKYALMIGLGWSLLGVFVVGTGNIAVRIGLAAAELFEQLFQLAVNTLSFARVGAFALAHAGLSQAIVSLADVAGHGGWLVMLLGNLFIIALEGLVVFIQTTRLVLFEFFIRFLRGEGQGFTPLPAPDYFAFTDTRSQS